MNNRQAINARYRSKNKEKIRQLNKVYRKNEPDKVKACKDKWEASNKETRREYSRQWRANNKEKSNGIFRLNCANRRIKCSDKLSDGLVERLLELQKGKCACCGTDIVNNYHVDHIMPLSLGGKNEDSNIQLLTPACNLSKRAKHPIDHMQEKGMLL